MLFSPALDDAKHGFSWPEMYKENLAGTLEAYDHHVFTRVTSPGRRASRPSTPILFPCVSPPSGELAKMTSPSSYVVNTGTQDKSGAKRIDLLRGQKLYKVDVTLLPQELDAMENVLPAKYEFFFFKKRNFLLPVSDVNIMTLICYLSWNCSRYEEAREEKKLRNQCEDSSDMVAKVCYI
ncbi:hypothetical protein glysoja_047625 [Glycine soja]|uniref:Uncharacterized protein n=1 Tax=Glycine soja TaxID=3848 RepID=A0A0B2RNX3_GLYSO|nr:hypothetical protein glysoja_047625 [Glycine soja]